MNASQDGRVTVSDTATRPTISGKPSTYWRPLRYSLVGIFLAIYTVVVLYPYRECSVVKTVAESGAISTETSCAPMGLDSASALALILIVGALLWPDLAEVTVLGVNLKRRVAVAEQKVKDAEGSVRDLTAQVQTLVLRVDSASSSAASAQSSVHLYEPRPGWTRADGAEIRDQRERLHIPLSGPREHRPLPEVSDPQVAGYLLTGRIIELWEELDQIIKLRASAKTLGGGIVLEPTPRYSRDFWVNNRESIEASLKLRNAVAHAQNVPISELQDGVILLEGLVSRARETVRKRPGDGPSE